MTCVVLQTVMVKMYTPLQNHYLSLVLVLKLSMSHT